MSDEAKTPGRRSLEMLKTRMRAEAYATLDPCEWRRELWRRMVAPQDAPAPPPDSEAEKGAKP